MKIKLNAEEKRWCWWFSFFAAIITTLPYLYAYQCSADGFQFTGFLFGVGDGNSYIAKMLAGANGAWLFTTPYTGYPQQGMLAYLPYILLGKLTSPPAQHDQLVALFHLFRVAGIPAYVFATFHFLRLFIQKQDLVRWGTAVVTFGGGLGWVIALGVESAWANELPLEFYSPETFGFLSVWGLPHLLFARALLLWSLIEFINGIGEAQPVQRGIKIGLILLALGLVQPLTIVSAWFILGAYILFLWSKGRLWDKGSEAIPIQKLFGLSLPMLGLSFIAVLYNIVVFFFDPVMSIWQGQNKIFSPPVKDYLLAFAWLIPFVIVSVFIIIKNKDVIKLFLVGWLFIFPLLAYFPFNLQRRMPDGIWVCLIALTLTWVQTWTANKSKLLIPLYVQSFFPALLLLSGSIVTVNTPNMPLFRPADEIKAFEFLRQQVDPNDVVLAEFDTSNALPAWAPVRVITGHGPESVNLSEIAPRVNSFYQFEETSEDLKLLNEFGIRYVYYGPIERKNRLGEPNIPGLELIYSDKGYNIYRVNLESVH